MYPVVRILWGALKTKRQPKLGMFDENVSEHMCLPWDIDLWRELNNGRTLTLYDLGRTPLAIRTGLYGHLLSKKWGLTIAGSMIRYRRRILMFERFKMRSRAIGWDDKFLYIEQSIWKKSGECASHLICRTAFVGKSGMVPAPKVVESFGHNEPSPELPDWVQSWAQTEDLRPWPPMQDQT